LQSKSTFFPFQKTERDNAMDDFFAPCHSTNTSVDTQAMQQSTYCFCVLPFKGMWQTAICKNQPVAFIFCHSRRGKGEMTLLIVFIFSSLSQHQHLPSTHSATISLLFLFFCHLKGKGGKPATCCIYFSHSGRGNGIMPWLIFLHHATTPAPLTHNATINLLFLFFCHSKGECGKPTICNNQPVASIFLPL